MAADPRDLYGKKAHRYTIEGLRAFWDGLARLDPAEQRHAIAAAALGEEDIFALDLWASAMRPELGHREETSRDVTRCEDSRCGSLDHPLITIDLYCHPYAAKALDLLVD